MSDPKAKSSSVLEITEPHLHALAEHVAGAVRIAFVKAAAHQRDPQQHPMPGSAAALENRVLRVLSKHDKARSQAARKLLETLDAPAARAKLKPGPLAKIDLRSSTSVLQQARAAGLPAGAKLSAEVLGRLQWAAAKVKAVAVPEPAVQTRVASATPVAVPAKSESPIDKKYQALGGEKGALGKPVGEVKIGDGTMQRDYEHGAIFWTAKTGAHELHGDILAKYRKLGGPASFLRWPRSDETATPDKKGRYNEFEGGVIYWLPGLGAREVHGAIWGKWAELGYETGYLGYPTTDETPTPDTIGRYNHFQGGSIYWTPQTGAHAVRKEVREKWAQLGWELGFLGFPLADTAGTTTLSNKFQGGVIRWTRAGGAVVDKPITTLLLRLVRVKCHNVTYPKGHDDEMKLGSVATDSLLQVRPGASVDLGSFGSGKDKAFTSELVRFDLTRDAGWPKAFMVTTMLAEEDYGELSTAIRELAAALRADVEELVKDKTEEVCSAAMSALGLSAVLTPVGALVAVIVTAVLMAVWDDITAFIADLFDDEYFVPTPFAVTIPSVFHTWNQTNRSPDESWVVCGHEGRYEYWARWELSP